MMNNKESMYNYDGISDLIDRDKIQRHCNGLKEILSTGIPNDFAQGELHALNLVLNGFYLKK